MLYKLFFSRNEKKNIIKYVFRVFFTHIKKERIEIKSIVPMYINKTLKLRIIYTLSRSLLTIASQEMRD